MSPRLPCGRPSLGIAPRGRRLVSRSTSNGKAEKRAHADLPSEIVERLVRDSDVERKFLSAECMPDASPHRAQVSCQLPGKLAHGPTRFSQDKGIRAAQLTDSNWRCPTSGLLASLGSRIQLL